MIEAVSRDPRPRRPALAIEVRSIDYVPLAERHGKAWHLWPIWFTGSAQLATMAVGVIGIGLGGNLFWTAVAILLGCGFGTVFMAGHSAQGPQLGLPQLIQSRPQFGYLGALLVYLVAIVTYVGYNAFNQLLAGQTLHELLHVPSLPASLVFSGLAIVMAVLGYRSFHLLQRWLAYVLIAAMALYSIGIVKSGGFSAASLDTGDFRGIPFIAQFLVAAAYQLSWAIYVSDYSRYLPRDVSVSRSLWWTYFGAYLGGAWAMLVGATAAALSPALNVAQGLVHAGDLILPGFGPAILLLAVLGLVTSAAQNFYGASLTLLSIADTIIPQRATLAKRLIAMLVVSAAAITVALNASGNFINQFGDFLSVLLYLFTPWTAVNLVDFYVVRHGHFSITEMFKPNGIYGKWNWRGISAYFLGFALMIPFFSTGLYTGPVAKALGGADLAMPVGLVVSALYYWLVCRSLDIADEISRIAQLDRDLDPADSGMPARKVPNSGGIAPAGVVQA